MPNIISLQTQLEQKEQEILQLTKKIEQQDTKIFTLTEQIVSLQETQATPAKSISTQTQTIIPSQLPSSPLRQQTFTVIDDKTQLRSELEKIQKDIKSIKSINPQNMKKINNFKDSIIRLIQNDPSKLQDTELQELIEDTIILLLAQYLILTQTKIIRTAYKFNIEPLFTSLKTNINMIDNIKKRLKDPNLTKTIEKKLYNYDWEKLNNYIEGRPLILVGGLNSTAIRMLNYKNNL